MNVKHNAAHWRRRVMPAVLAGTLFCEAAPLALAQTVTMRGTEDTSANTRVLEMFRGEVRILHIPGTIKRIAIGNGKLLTANVVDGSLMLLGEQDGITSLVVWNERGIALQTTVRVAKAEVNASLEQLRAVLKSVPGLHIDAIGSNIVLSGTVHRDMVAIVKSATQDMKNVIDTTKVDEGDALRKTVHFKVQIMEVTRNAQRNLGIAWDSAFRGPQIGGSAAIGTGAAKAVVSGTNYFLAGIASNITSQINFAVENGDAFVLAAPELNTKSGGTASFLAGGEVPIPQSGALGTTNVEYKQYGIKLSIVPVVDANNVISAHLTTEISQIDPTVTYAGMPGFLTRNTSSDISMRGGETLAISGLVSADAANSSNGMPFLSQVPVIGQLFRSDSFRAKKSDLVIFVTPVISDPDLDPNADLLARADKVDRRFRDEYGNPDPLVAADDKATRTTAPRRTIAPTPALLPEVIRSTPPQPSLHAPRSQMTLPPQDPAGVTAAPTATGSDVARASVVAPPTSASTPPAGVADALRMLNAAPPPQAASNDAARPLAARPVAATATTNASNAANGKVPSQQIDVLGRPAN
ncbi:pilus assembly protein N-terminal domain-containing protein [Paraburkholderia sp. D15]|uniref:type II and III secretion system protein family protein n=1 Tax=Paraburkholderia sp. D15 TaxID=2880218 RepID=UPI002478B9C8|nr:pilus assembly protein N-terminal domain-containing protein [Paraburkholderia sp. D15]WGS54600.1 pilus assembly protein N-terminal domain-containing protein [Paraburkholderia sp. D15]